MFTAPFPPYDPTDKQGFSYDTVLKRWPVILTGIVDTLHRENHNLFIANDGATDKVDEGKKLIERISKLKYQMARDHVLEPIAQDGESHVETYNQELARLAEESKNTWYTAPWLFAECYLYRLLRSYVAQTTHWVAFDPFLSQKIDTFQKSGVSIYKIATSIRELEHEKGKLAQDDANFKIIFREMIQMCLWGNATDLSLLTNLSLSDIEHLQSVGKEAQAARQSFILKDDQDSVWNHIQKVRDGRVDFILDNSGYELFTDLVFADFLVTYTPYVSKVVFHPKLIPWFVSDVTPPDFVQTIQLLLDDKFFGGAPTDEEKDNLNHMAQRWKGYIDEGIFSLPVPSETPLGGAIESIADFWTTHLPYWDMKLHAPNLWQELHNNSDLVILKGDLNYRKVTGDVAWPVDTPFETAIGPLAGSFPLLSLRTNKADVAVGVDKEVAAKLDASGERWRVNGQYALISYCPKTG